MQDLIVMGPGQLGRLFAGAALRLGHRVTPITPDTPDPAVLINASPADAPILVTVPESALADAVSHVPTSRHERLVFVQNELFPADWRALLSAGAEPTVLVFWSNVKPGKPLQIGRPSSVYGPLAPLVRALHGRLEPSIPCAALQTRAHLLQEIIAKYAFILTINALGVIENRTLGAWLEERAELEAVLDDATRIGARIADVDVEPGPIHEAVRDAMRGLASIGSRGRSAPRRLRRALTLAREHDLSVPGLDACARHLGT